MKQNRSPKFLTPPSTTRGYSSVTAANSRRLTAHKHAHGIVPNSTARRSYARKLAYKLGAYLTMGTPKQNARRLALVAGIWFALALLIGVILGVFA